MTASTTSDSGVDTFFDGALRRITRLIVVLGVGGLPFIAWVWGRAGALGYSLAVVVAYLNFLWLARGVEAIAERITEHGSREKGGGAVAKAVLRYALVVIAGYGIFRGSEQGFYAFFVGLCVPVFAMLCEAGFELFIAIRKGS
jgi:hypothetical protein